MGERQGFHPRPLAEIGSCPFSRNSSIGRRAQSQGFANKHFVRKSEAGRRDHPLLDLLSRTHRCSRRLILRGGVLGEEDSDQNKSHESPSSQLSTGSQPHPAQFATAELEQRNGRNSSLDSTNFGVRNQYRNETEGGRQLSAESNVTLLLQQAENENATAMFMVGVCFLEGLGGLQVDEVAAFRCFLAAAQKVSYPVLLLGWLTFFVCLCVCVYNCVCMYFCLFVHLYACLTSVLTRQFLATDRPRCVCRL
jgi:hypothetical protein